jgi:hypothetical protein
MKLAAQREGARPFLSSPRRKPGPSFRRGYQFLDRDKRNGEVWAPAFAGVTRENEIGRLGGIQCGNKKSPAEAGLFVSR